MKLNLLADILEHLAQNKEARERFNSNSHLTGIEVSMKRSVFTDGGGFVSFYTPADQFAEQTRSGCFEYLDLFEKPAIIQTALSNTPDGKPVCEFLGKITLNYQSNVESLKKVKFNSYYKTLNEVILEEKEKYLIKTLNHLLYRTFTEALFEGNTFDQALEKTNLIYLENV